MSSDGVGMRVYYARLKLAPLYPLSTKLLRRYDGAVCALKDYKLRVLLGCKAAREARRLLSYLGVAIVVMPDVDGMGIVKILYDETFFVLDSRDGVTVLRGVVSPSSVVAIVNRVQRFVEAPASLFVFDTE